MQDGCIVCPTTDSTFDLRSGAIKDWYPKNPVLRVLTPALRTLFVYPVKTDEENIFINMKGTARSDASAEIVFSGKAQPGVTATDVNVDEVRTSKLSEKKKSSPQAKALASTVDSFGEIPISCHLGENGG